MDPTKLKSSNRADPKIGYNRNKVIDFTTPAEDPVFYELRKYFFCWEEGDILDVLRESVIFQTQRLWT